MSLKSLLSAVVIAQLLATGPANAQEAPPEHGTLKFQFIGNCSFRITDGTVTVVTDFPYRSGAFGNMKYDMEDIVLKGDVVCLVSHGHRDHFANVEYRSGGWSLIAPEEITSNMQGYRVFPIEENMTYEDIEITAIQTPHVGSIHYSFLVRWHGLRLFFTGDTDDPTTLLAEKDLDIVFVNIWLLDTLAAREARVDTKRLVVYHHTDDMARNQNLVDFQNRVIPKQGDTFEIEY